MPGNPAAKLKRVADLVEWYKELSADFDKLLPPCYRFNGVASTDDQRRDAWANADKCIVMAGAALTELESVLRSHIVTSTVDRGGRHRYHVKAAPVKVAGD